MDVKMARLSGVMILTSSVLLTACGKSDRVVEETFPVTKAECAATAVPNRFLVRWKDGSTSIERAKDRDAFIEEVLLPNQDEIEFVENDQIVSLSQPNVYSHSIQSLASEPLDWGQKAIQAPAVWAQGVEGEGVIVAIIDSGLDTGHPQFKGQLAVNPNEVLNGIDDDGNGLIDDVIGYDFHSGTGNVADRTGHGTHVAGIIAADHAAGPVKGVAPKAKILPLDFMDDAGRGSLGHAIEAIEYAVSRGARVINASWGGAPCSTLLGQSIRRLENRGVLFVTAAGNEGKNLDFYPSYPASFEIPGQITVGASTFMGYTAGFSNYSYNYVHLVAPGHMIFSTYPGNQNLSESGTSMAAPFVSAAAALLWSARPYATPAQIRAAILASVDPGNFQVFTRGQLNVERALEELKRLAP